MIILRQKEFSILNNLGLIGNTIGNELSRKELQARGNISEKKSKKLKDKLIKHVSKYHKVSESDAANFLPDQDNLDWEVGKEPKGFDIFAGRDPDRVRYTRKKNRTGSIKLPKKASPFIIAHEYGHSLDYASPGGAQRFTEDGRARSKTDNLGKINIGGGRVKDNKDALDLGKKMMEREVAADINALKLLKKRGASQKELDRAKQEAKAALRSYKTATKSHVNYLMSDSSLSEDLKFRREHMRGARKQYRDAVKKIDNMYGPNKLAKKEKAALIGTGAALVGSGIGIAIHKHNKKKKEQKQKEREIINDYT